jgi:transmembrane sensor
MSVSSQRLEYLLQQYAANVCTNSELLELLGAIDTASANQELHTALKTVWSRINNADEVPPIDKEKIFKNIITPAPVYSIKKRLAWLRIAAAACILVLAVAGFYYWFNHPSKTSVVQRQAYPVNQPVSYTRHIILPDGSIVVLHANSTIDYSTSFNSGERKLTLSGEAYFDIAHDTTRPFTIYTGTIKTTVLGTAFNIRAYPGTNEVTVAVTRGKVKVENEKNVLALLEQDQQVTCNIQQSIAKQQKVNAAELVTDWTKQDMIFEEVSFEEITKIVSKRYGVTIEFKNPALKPCRIKASFGGTENLEKVLEVLTTTRGATYMRNSDNIYIIDGAGCE